MPVIFRAYTIFSVGSAASKRVVSAVKSRLFEVTKLVSNLKSVTTENGVVHGVGHGVHLPIGAHLIKLPIEGHHFAIEGVKSTQSEGAVAGQLFKTDPCRGSRLRAAHLSPMFGKRCCLRGAFLLVLPQADMSMASSKNSVLFVRFMA